MLLSEATVTSIARSFFALMISLTKRACFRHETTSVGSEVEICGLVVVAEACQLSGAFDRSAMLLGRSREKMLSKKRSSPHGARSSSYRCKLASTATGRPLAGLPPLCSIGPMRLSLFPAFCPRQACAAAAAHELALPPMHPHHSDCRAVLAQPAAV